MPLACRGHILEKMKNIALLLFLAHTSTGVAAQWKTNLELESQHFLVPSTIRHDRQSGVGAELTGKAASFGVRLKVFLSHQESVSWAFVDEAFYTVDGFVVGKRKLDLQQSYPLAGVSVLNRVHHLMAWDPINPEHQGLTQVSWATPNQRLQVGVGLLWLPAFYPFVTKQGDTLFSPNRLSSLPPSNVDLMNQNLELQLRSAPSELLSDMVTGQRFWVSGKVDQFRWLYSFGPEWGYRTKTLGGLSFDGEELIATGEIQAKRFYAHLVGFQSSWKLHHNLNLNQEASYLGRLNSGDLAYQRASVAQNILSLQWQTRVRPIGLKLQSAWAGTALLGEQDTEENELFASRITQKAELSWRKSLLTALWDLGLSHRDERIAFEASQQLGSAFQIQIGVDLLRAPTGLGYWSRYAKADRLKLNLNWFQNF